MATENKYKSEFIEILKDTGRENIDYVIEDLEDLGFFEAPASSKNHFNFEGGLVEHSLNVYKIAIMLKEQIIKLRPDIVNRIPDDSIAIAALLHDVCKADIYKKVVKKVKNEIGVWEPQESYNIDYSNFPLGHGEKSVIILLRSGLDLSDDEIIAIRWHMGGWDLPFQSSEMIASNKKAKDVCPLLTLIHTADTLAAGILEGK
ncbi:MAG: HD domain-containing protein [Muribaculaceae bacterium]|nr:HD domain-containing protein [Muribaculaceae bacterium]